MENVIINLVVAWVTYLICRHVLFKDAIEWYKYDHTGQIDYK